MPKVEIGLEQLAKALDELSPGDLETLEIMLSPELRSALTDRWAEAKSELRQGKTLNRGCSARTCDAMRTYKVEQGKQLTDGDALE